jgi:hypothetical protein
MLAGGPGLDVFKTFEILKPAFALLTMCNRVAIILRFRELSLACLCLVACLAAQPALAASSGKTLAEL